ncbi:MAG: class I tRNA ligase family protein, partial [Halobacteriaceae archaeon]
DYRCSGNDLINNHLTFFLFHHAELFEPEEWPEGITVMGMGLLEGEAMSSSKGHVVLPTEAIEEYGADTVRFFLLNAAEPWQDYDWRADAVESVRDQLAAFVERADAVAGLDAPDADVAVDESGEPVLETPDGETRSLSGPDRWLLSRLQHVIGEVTDALEEFETRRASQEAFFRFEEDLRWYRRRADLDRPAARWVRRTVLRARLRLLAPFVPFLTNELHEALTGEPAEDADWPTVDERLESTRAEVEEELVESLVDDVREVVQVTGTEPETVHVYSAAGWKQRVLDAVVEVGPDRGAVMGTVMDDPDLRERGDAVNDLVGSLVESVRGRDDAALAALADLDETAVYEGAADFLGAEFDAEIRVVPEDETGDEKATQAEPLRPAIRLA